MQMIYERYREFVTEHLLPLEERLLADGFAALTPELDALRQRARDEGLWAPWLEKPYGGGMSLSQFAPVSEMLGFSPLGHYVFNCQAPDVGNIELLLAFGTPDQKARFLEPLAAGDIRSCFAMTEPDQPGSNPLTLSATARADGDGFVINGRKWFTSSADGASFAIVMAMTDPDAENRYERYSQIIVPTDTPGYRHVRRIPIMGEEGSGWMSHSEVDFDDCRVPADHLLGRRGDGFKMAQIRLGPGRIHHCMRWIGLCERALDMMCRRAATRELSDGVLLGSKQTIQHWIAESRAAIDASRLLVMDTARRIDADGASAARVAVSSIKFHVARVLQEVTDRALQTHGALGVTDDTILSWIFRHERAARIYDGPDEVHKSVVARHVLKPYGIKVRL